MPSKYSVVQFLPDPTTGERINIGVITFNETDARVRFLSRWERVKAFASRDVGFLRAVTGEILEAVERIATRNVLAPPPTEREGPGEHSGAASRIVPSVELLIRKWSGCIELTEPRGSLKDPEPLINSLCLQFLTEPTPRTGQARHRKHAIAIAVRGLYDALAEAVGPAVDELLHQQYRVQGMHALHRVDAAVANGAPYLAVEAVSFEGPRTFHTEARLDSIAWTLTDLKASRQGITIAVLALPPVPNTPHFDGQQQEFQERKSVYQRLGAAFIPEADYSDWARDAVKILEAKGFR